MSNYPPGVTGHEFAIAGPDWEEEMDHLCPTCEVKQQGVAWGYDREAYWCCDVCHDQIEVDIQFPDDGE